MKFAVIGLGSMGKRRISLLINGFKDIEVCGIDVSEERRLQAEELFRINTYVDLDTAICKENPSAVLICSPPLSHSSIILKCISKGLHIFSEINLVRDKYEEIIKNADKKNVKLFLSSTMLYRREIEIIGSFVSQQKSKINYRYHVGQYLPDWHPWEDYRDFFVGDKQTNACREIFAIDLPWIIRTFGKIKNVTAMKDNISTLEIQYPDNYFVLLEHENGNKGIIMADIVSRKAVRDILVYSEDLYLMWGGTPDTLYKYNIDEKTTEKIEAYTQVEKNDGYADIIIENAYAEELKAFIGKITGIENQERYTFEDDKYTLKLIDRIERIKK